jgi:hypothetical protein
MNTLLYTAITAGYDTPRTDIECFSEADYSRFKEGVYNVKALKVIPHLLLWKRFVDVFFWVDGTVKTTKPVEYYIDTYLKDADMALFKHSVRSRVIDEINTIKSIPIYANIVRSGKMDDQYAYYQDRFKYAYNKLNDNSLFECIVMIKRNNPIVNDFMEKWWAHITAWQQRDQISFPMVLKEFPELKINYIPGDVRKHQDFTFQDHCGR